MSILTGKPAHCTHNGHYRPLSPLLNHRPSYEERGRMARWLVHKMIWGTLATLDKTTGDPIGGVNVLRNSTTGRAAAML